MTDDRATDAARRPVLQVIIASTRPGRIGRPIGDWVVQAATAHGGFDVELVDLAEVALPIFDEPNHPRFGNYEHQHSKDWSATVSRADAFVFVMCEYNHSFNAALKNAIDYLHSEWQHKPVGFVSYGGVAAGTRAVQAIKPVLAGLRMVPVVEAVALAMPGQLLDDEGVVQPTEQMAGMSKGMFDEILAQVAILAPRRAS